MAISSTHYDLDVLTVHASVLNYAHNFKLKLIVSTLWYSTTVITVFIVQTRRTILQSKPPLLHCFAFICTSQWSKYGIMRCFIKLSSDRNKRTLSRIDHPIFSNIYVLCFSKGTYPDPEADSYCNHISKKNAWKLVATLNHFFFIEKFFQFWQIVTGAEEWYLQRHLVYQVNFRFC